MVRRLLDWYPWLVVLVGELDHEWHPWFVDGGLDCCQILGSRVANPSLDYVQARIDFVHRKDSGLHSEYRLAQSCLRKLQRACWATYEGLFGLWLNRNGV